MSTDDRLKKLIQKQAQKTETKRESKKTKKSDPVIDFSKLGEMSESELVEIANMIGVSASRQLPREDLIDLVLGAAESAHVDPVEHVREKIHHFVQGNKIMVASMPCDLNCPQCPKRAVIACYTVNHDLFNE